MNRSAAKPVSRKTLAIFAVWSVLGLVLAIYGGVRMFDGLECRNWRRAEGEIIRSEIHEVDITTPGGEDLCKPVVQYRYRPSDSWRVGSVITDEDFQFMDREQAQTMVDGHTVGTRIHVFFDPADPSRSMLRCEIKENARIEVLMGVSVLIVVVLAGIKRFRPG